MNKIFALNNEISKLNKEVQDEEKFKDKFEKAQSFDKDEYYGRPTKTWEEIYEDEEKK